MGAAAETTSHSFDPFYLCVYAFTSGIGNPIFCIRYYVVYVIFKGLGCLFHCRYSGMGRPKIPSVEVLPHVLFVFVVPKVTKIIFDRTGSAGLEI